MTVRRNFAALLAAVGLGIAAPAANAQLASGNVVVERVGDGSAALSTSATAVFLDTYLPGIANQSSPTSTATILSAGTANATTNLLTLSGTAITEGQITRSSNGLFITLSGFSAPAGTATIASTTAVAYNRVVLTVDGGGTSANYRTSSTFYSGNDPRSATFNGTNFYAAGGSTGIGFYNATSGNSTVISSTSTNNRVVSIQNGQLYFSTGAGTTRGVYAVGTGVPTTTGQTSTNVINTGGSGSSSAFQFNSAGTIAYIADDNTLAGGGGVQKWTFSASTWSLAYTFGSGAGLTNGTRGLAVDWSNPNAPVLYATTADSTTKLIRITDTGSGSSSTTLATAGTNTAFRGADIALLPAVYTSRADGGFNASGNWSLNVNSADRNGINLLFQNVNNGSGSGAAVTITNNQTALTSIFSLVFRDLDSGRDGGATYGSGSFTQYTIGGSNGLTLNGKSTTNIDVAGAGTGGFSGVYNASGVTQTINLPLTISSTQSFKAQSGGLNFGGPITLGTASTSGLLSVTGPGNTTISGAIGNASGATNSLTKNGTGTLELNGTNTFSGTTTVNVGTLRGEGTIAGAVIVNAGGTIRGGSTANPTAPLTVNNKVTVLGASSSAGTIAVDLNNASTTGATVGKLAITGGSGVLNFDTATNNGPVALQLLNDGNLTLTSTYTFTIANSAGGYTLNDGALLGGGSDEYRLGTDFTLGSSNFSFTNVKLKVVGSDLNLTFTTAPVPEPAMVLGIAAAGLGLGGAVRRLRRGKATA